MPTLLLPDDARNWLRNQWAEINRSYRQPLLRLRALDHAITQLKAKYPDAFVKEGA